MIESDVVADFIYSTANPFVKELSEKIGDQAFVESLERKKTIPKWKNSFESLLKSYKGQTFSFKELEYLATNKNTIQPRYRDIILALYNSLKDKY